MRIFSFTILLLLICQSAWSADWYVRADGGTATQCTGHTNAAYPGSGTGQACAFNHPAWLLGLGGSLNRMARGDALYFKDAEKYVIGMPDAPNGQACNSAWPYSCTLGEIPGGTDASHRTKVYGYGWDTGCSGTKTQLWGENRLSVVLTLKPTDSHFDIQCLDITDHSSCIVFGPLDGYVDGFPVQCDRDTYPQGPWASSGIYSAATDDVLLTNVDIHGLASTGILAINNKDWTLTNTKITSNGWVGWNSDGENHCLKSDFSYSAACSAHDSRNVNDTTCQINGAYSATCPACTADITNSCIWPKDDYRGTTVLKSGTRIDWNGCGERYPLQSSDLDAASNHHHCFEQAQGGYGDGVGLGDGDPGNWSIADSSISWNTSDGLDLVHALSAGRYVKIYRSRFEGNNGNQVKLTTNHGYIENSIIVGNCGFFAGQTFTSKKDRYGNSVDMNFCRAYGNPITLGMGDNVDYSIYNNTILSNGDTTVLFTGSACSGASTHIGNNIIYAGSDFNGDSTNPYAGSPGQDDDSDIFFNDGRGTCSAFVPVEDYNICFRGKGGTDCVGAHDQKATDPLFTGTIKMGPYNKSGYYKTADYYKQLHIRSGGPETGVNSADETVKLSGSSNDVTNAPRGTQWDTGAYEYGSSDWTGSSGASTTSPTSNTGTGSGSYRYYKWRR